MRNKMLALLVGLFLISGCGGADTSLDNQGDMIVGGTPTTGYPEVVALYAAEPGADKGALCTGAIISDTVILTAAHCVHPEMIGEAAVIRVLAGHDLTQQETACPCYDVKEAHYHPNFNHNSPTAGNDIAVVILAEPVDVEPVAYMQTPLTDSMVGEPALVVGYGVNNGWNNKGAGIKREATIKLNSFDNNFVKTGGWGKTICSGDSGGPVMMEVDGQMTVVGVNSFGMIFCMAAASSTRVDSYLDFIEQWL